MASAQWAARAGPSNVARTSSPRRLTSRPWKRATSRRVSSSKRSSSRRQPESPRSTACSVEATMSANRTVASTRSAGGPVPRAGQELLDLAQDRPRCRRTRRCDRRPPPRRSARRECRRPAPARPRRRRLGSSVRCSTSVGTETARRMDDTSMAAAIRISAVAAPGVAHCRSVRAKTALKLRVGADAGAALGDHPAGAPLRLDERDERGAVVAARRRCGARTSRRGRGGPPAPDRSRRTARSSGRPRRRRAGWPASSRRRPGLPGRRPCAPRGSAARRPAPGPTARCRACRTG